MAILTFYHILQVLALGVVAALARPQGNGQTSQYHYVNGAGEVKHGFVNGLGHYQKSQRLTSGDVIGEYGYIDSNGAPVSVRYTAGKGGFVVLPTPYNANVRSAIPASTAPAADLSQAKWETSYDFSHSNGRSFPNSDLHLNSVWRIAQPQNGFANHHQYVSGPVNN